MSSSVVPGAAVDFSPGGGAPALDRLLIDLRRRSWGDPAATGKGLMAASAAALGAHTVVVWVVGQDGRPAAVLHHPRGAVGCGAPADPAVDGEAPSLDALRADGVACLTRPRAPTPSLDAGVWARGRARRRADRAARRPTPVDRRRAGVRRRRSPTASRSRRSRRAAAPRASSRCASASSRWTASSGSPGMGSWSIDLAHDVVTLVARADAHPRRRPARARRARRPSSARSCIPTTASASSTACAGCRRRASRSRSSTASCAPTARCGCSQARRPARPGAGRPARRA